MSSKKYNIGPGAIAVSGTSGGPAFALANPDFIAIQTYVEAALSLPKTKEEFKQYLGTGAPADMSDFDPLVGCYKSMFDSSTKWKTDTFDDLVHSASDVYNYGNKATVYYRPILPLADILTRNPQDEDAKRKLKAILDALEKDAKDLGGRVKGVYDKVKTFADASQADHDTLVVKNEGGLYARYEKKYGKTSTEVEELNAEIAAQRLVLQAANDEYDHDVIVASTTPTYGWMFPIGTVAAAVVAGIYGDKAVKALQRARAAQAKINDLTDRVAANARVMTALHLSNFSITNITQKLERALPVIQGIQGVWNGIADDCGNIVKIIDQDIRQALPILMDLGVEEAIKAWAGVAAAADKYRNNAYVHITPSVSMDAWKLDHLHPVAAASLVAVA